MNHPKQHTLWLLAALAAPIAHFSGTGWFTAALTVLAVLPLTLLPRGWKVLPKPIAYLEILWLGAVAGLLLPFSAVNWPSDNTLAVPMTILILAAFTNAAAAPRIGAVVALCMALLAIPVGIAASARLEPGWLAPAVGPWSWGLAIVLLLPALPAAGERRRHIPYAALLAVTIMLLVQGVISSRVAAAVPDPFYQTARTLGHLEPVVACGLTLGWYALTCFLLQSAAHIAHSSGIDRKWSSVLVVGTSTFLILFPQQPNAWSVTVISLFLWIIAPFLTKIKNFEKI